LRRCPEMVRCSQPAAPSRHDGEYRCPPLVRRRAVGAGCVGLVDRVERARQAPDFFSISSIAALSSASDRSALPPRAGMLFSALVALASRPSTPPAAFLRSPQAAASPIFGAPMTPVP